MYGELAYNLAVSIRASGNSYPICLVYNTSAVRHLNDEQLKIFDDKVFMDEHFISIRMKLPEITPYDYTLQVDADMLWLKKDAGELFKLLDKMDFTVENYGYSQKNGQNLSVNNYSHWAKFDEICNAYPIEGKLYKCCNSFILFKKTDSVKELFALWSEINSNPKCKYFEWCETCPDEFGLNIALNLLKKEPHQSPWQLGVWFFGNTTYIPPAKHAVNYYTLNAGGNVKRRSDIDYYNLVARVAYDKLNLQFQFPLKQKRDYIRERNKM